MAFYSTWPGGWEVLAAPLFMLLAILTALGLGFLLSAINVRYRDVRYMIPVFLQVLPLLSGVMYAVESIPEKWQWILSLNPMTAVISGWRWAVLDGTAPVTGQVAAQRLRRGPAAPLRPRGVPVVGATLRGHDLMATAIDAQGLGKRYRIGELQAAYGTLRESLSHAAKRFAGQEQPSLPRGDLGAQRRVVRGAAGRGARCHRPERRREVDSAEGPDAHHLTDRGDERRSGAGWEACSRSGPASTPS